MSIPAGDGRLRRRDITEVDTVGDGAWPVDPDLVPSLESTLVDDQRGTVVVPSPPRYGRGAGLTIFAILVIAALVAALVWVLTARQGAPAAATSHPTTPPAASSSGNVPSLVGRPLAEAKGLLDARGLPVAVRRTPRAAREGSSSHNRPPPDRGSAAARRCS